MASQLHLIWLIIVWQSESLKPRLKSTVFSYKAAPPYSHQCTGCLETLSRSHIFLTLELLELSLTVSKCFDNLKSHTHMHFIKWLASCVEVRKCLKTPFSHPSHDYFCHLSGEQTSPRGDCLKVCSIILISKWLAPLSHLFVEPQIHGERSAVIKFRALTLSPPLCMASEIDKGENCEKRFNTHESSSLCSMGPDRLMGIMLMGTPLWTVMHIFMSMSEY